MPLLVEKRIALREISEKDLDGIFKCYSNAEVMKDFGRTPIKNKQEALEIIKQNIMMKKERTGVRYVAYLKESEEFIGLITMKRYDTRNYRAEIDYIVLPEYQRKGFASEMLSDFINKVFDNWELERISAYVFLENIPSYKLLEKFRFKKEGILRNWIYEDGNFYDTSIYSLIQSDANS